ncbi:glutamate-1-semialdehyde 2,1-aminomutase [Desulfurococcaceae archaeon AG1]|jgi:glutamate-1-semialdehyde 2,1-aminomutase|nr:glutamate-1-semialdehyde 2,1-aminomutase [Desulfurococcaceae archaeon AG1]
MVEMLGTGRSRELYDKALRLIPGGVNSPVRAFKPYPVFIARARGSRVYDVDGNSYIDYVMGYGANLFGHSPEWLVKRISEILWNGVLYGMPTEAEVILAEKLVKMIPNIEMVRLVNTGTEATMSAIRLARGYTEREYIVKFRGCFHGSHDYVLVSPGSGAAGIPSHKGVLRDAAAKTLVTEYNDPEGLEKVMRIHGDTVAAIILEPVAANMGLVPPDTEFLKTARELCNTYGCLLIFDEIVTGFRIAPGGAQEYFGIKADLITIGKALGSGFPIAAYAGGKRIMELIAPSGPVYQAGTYSGNPVSVAAAIATLDAVEREGSKIYSRLRKIASEIEEEAGRVISGRGINAHVNRFEGMLQIFMTRGPVRNYSDAVKSNTKLYSEFHLELMKRGVFIPPSQLEAWFPSYAHTDEDLSITLEAVREALGRIS